MSTLSFDPPCVPIPQRLVFKDENPRNIYKISPMLRKPVADAEGKMRQRKMWPVLCCVRNVFSYFRVFLAVLRSCPHVHLMRSRPFSGYGQRRFRVRQPLTDSPILPTGALRSTRTLGHEQTISRASTSSGRETA